MGGAACHVVRMGLTSEALAAWVAASCAAQGVPVHLTDPLVIQKVVALMGGAAGGRRALARSAGPMPPVDRS